jgi:hypothetical protein
VFLRLTTAMIFWSVAELNVVLGLTADPSEASDVAIWMPVMTGGAAGDGVPAVWPPPASIPPDCVGVESVLRGTGTIPENTVVPPVVGLAVGFNRPPGLGDGLAFEGSAAAVEPAAGRDPDAVRPAAAVVGSNSGVAATGVPVPGSMVTSPAIGGAGVAAWDSPL